MYEKNYYEEYKQLVTISIIYTFITCVLVCVTLSSWKKYDKLESLITKNETIEIEDTRYICNAIETKEVVWKKVDEISK